MDTKSVQQGDGGSQPKMGAWADVGREQRTPIAGKRSEMCDGIRIGEPGSKIAKLVGHGFVEISTANGQDAIAKVTWAGAPQRVRGYLDMMALVALISIGMIGYLYGCDVADD